MKTNTPKLNVFAKLAVCVAVVFCILQITSLMIERANLNEVGEELTEKIEENQKINEELENKLNAPFDADYIISVAKEKLGYCFPEEVIFITN